MSNLIKITYFSIALLFFSPTAFASNWQETAGRFIIEGPGSFIASAQDVTGIQTATQTMAYRHSDSSLFSVVKMPGIAKYGAVSINRMVIKNKDAFWHFHAEVTMNTINRGTWVIHMLDDDGQDVMRWELNNAWPIQISGPNLQDNGLFVTISTMKLAHEQMIMSSQ